MLGVGRAAAVAAEQNLAAPGQAEGRAQGGLAQIGSLRAEKFLTQARAVLGMAGYDLQGRVFHAAHP